MKIFVINKDQKPLMPTTSRKARLLLKSGQARIVKRTPFTIQLLYGSSGYKQEVKVGVDSGYQNIGFSAVTAKEELLGGEVKMMTGMSERLSERAKYRRQRRNRLRYRQSRFENRTRLDGWLAPSIQHKLNTHFKVIEMIKQVLPVSHLSVEVADFDIQKIKNPGIHGKQYQEGEQLGFSHLRQYILHRDSYKCQNPNCQNQSEKPILQVHHLGFWKDDRTNRPANLITLCTKCHTSANHKKGKFLYGWQPKLKSFKGETFMSIVRWRLLEPGYSHTFGYITKAIRRELELDKSHHNDAFVIAGGTNQKRIKPLMLEQIRRHKRSLEQFYDAKYVDIRNGQVKSGVELFSGRRTRDKSKNGENLRKYRGQKVRQGRRAIKKFRYPYRQHDLVRYQGRILTVVGVQNKGTRVSLKPYEGCPTKYLTAPISQVLSLRKRGGICEAI